jgi:hypothetical protein
MPSSRRTTLCIELSSTHLQTPGSATGSGTCSGRAPLLGGSSPEDRYQLHHPSNDFWPSKDRTPVFREPWNCPLFRGVEGGGGSGDPLILSIKNSHCGT